jgi:NAD+ synthase (glutamine-hydrolysing)
MIAGQEFFNLYSHDFVRVAVGVPRVRVADPAFNSEQTIVLMHQAVASNALLVLFPELGLSAYSCDDLLQQSALLLEGEKALNKILHASGKWPIVAVVGMPIRIDHVLFNCAVVFAQGRMLGVVPKTYLPNYREFYEVARNSSDTTVFRQSICSRARRNTLHSAC